MTPVQDRFTCTAIMLAEGFTYTRYALQQKRGHFFLQMTLMTSWAVVCDVYFLAPQSQLPEESAQQFAERVQHMIARKANLKVAPWDGYLKYYNLGKKVSFPRG